MSQNRPKSAIRLIKLHTGESELTRRSSLRTARAGCVPDEIHVHHRDVLNASFAGSEKTSRICMHRPRGLRPEAAKGEAAEQHHGSWNTHEWQNRQSSLQWLSGVHCCKAGIQSSRA